MSSEVIIRTVESSDINEVVSFYNTLEGDNRTTEQWVWEYKGSYHDLFVFTVAEDDGRIVGTQGMIPIYLNIKGERYLSGKSENSLLNPAYRGGVCLKSFMALPCHCAK